MNYFLVGIDSLPSTYDVYFERHRGNVPLAFVKALAWNESRMNPNSIDKSGAVGILQVIDKVREDFNKRHGASLADNDLLDAETNIKVASETLNRIVKAYETNHPHSLSPDWDSPRYVQLLVFGWNAGYSQADGYARGGGVQFVVTKLEKENKGITIDSVHENAERLKGASTLSNSNKVRWAKQVTADYFKEKKTTEFLEPKYAKKEGPGFGGVIILGTVGFFGYQIIKEG